MKELRNLFRIIVEAIIEILDIANSIATASCKAVGEIVKWCIYLTIIWPLVLMTVAMCVPHSSLIVVMPCLAILPFAGLAGYLILGVSSETLGLGTIAGVSLFAKFKTLREKSKKLQTVVAAELVLGAYLALVPLDPISLVPLLVLLAMIAFFSKGVMRTLAMIGVIAITIVFLLPSTWWQRPVHASETLFAGQVLPADYGAAPCPANPDPAGPTESYNLSKRTGLTSIPITLSPHCFHGVITLPQNFAWFTAVIGDGPGDWVAVRCAGHHGASKVVRWHPDQDGNLKGIMDHCYTPGSHAVRFLVEGRGTLYITRTEAHL